MKTYTDDRYWHPWEWPFRFKRRKDGSIRGFWMPLWRTYKDRGFPRDVYRTLHIERGR